MKTIKSTDETLLLAARLIKCGNAATAKANKEIESGKETITRWLAENRGIVVSDLPIGEILNIADICLIEVASQNKFDEKRFSVEHTTEYESYKRDVPVKKFKPLV